MHRWKLDCVRTLNDAEKSRRNEKTTIKEFKLIKIQLSFFVFRSLTLFFPIHLTFSETSFIQYFYFGCLDLIFIRFDVLFRFFFHALFPFGPFDWRQMKCAHLFALACTVNRKFNWRFDAVHHIAITIRCSTLCVYSNGTFFSHFSWGRMK